MHIASTGLFSTTFAGQKALLIFFSRVKVWTGYSGLGYLILAHTAFCIPFAYLPIYIWASGLMGPLYGFLVPGDPSFVPIAAALVVAFLLLFFAYWGLGRLRGRLLRGRAGA